MEKKFALCATIKINILTLVLSEKQILNEAKNHNPLQVKWSVPKRVINLYTQFLNCGHLFDPFVLDKMWLLFK